MNAYDKERINIYSFAKNNPHISKLNLSEERYAPVDACLKSGNTNCILEAKNRDKLFTDFKTWFVVQNKFYVLKDWANKGFTTLFFNVFKNGEYVIYDLAYYFQFEKNYWKTLYLPDETATKENPNGTGKLKPTPCIMIDPKCIIERGYLTLTTDIEEVLKKHKFIF